MRRALLAIGVVIAVVAGYAIVDAVLGGGAAAPGRVGRPRGPAAVRRTARRGSSHKPRPVRSPAEMTRLGAVAAASNYLELVDAGSSTADARLRSETVPPLTGQALGAEPAAAALRSRLSPPAVLRGWQLGWAIEPSGSASITVAIWTVGLVVSRRIVVAPSWSTTLCTLRRIAGRWKVQGARTVPGPTPPADAGEPSANAEFVGTVQTFQPFHDAP